MLSCTFKHITRFSSRSFAPSASRAFTAATSSEIQDVFAMQSKNQWKIRKSTASERIQKLQQLKSVISAHENDVKDALYEDLRKADLSGELEHTYDDIDNTIANLEDWMAPQKVELSAMFANSAKGARVIYEPRGVVLLYNAWNFPFSLLFQPLTAIIGAGNCAMVKPNEMAPNTAAISATIIREAFAPEDVAVFEGGVDVANELSKLPVDHVFFTGSPGVGKIIMQAAAKNLTTCTLELGGKNPVLVDRDTDIAAAANRIAYLRMFNSGQVCLCPENIYVHEDRVDEFTSAAQETFKTYYHQDSNKLNIDVSGKTIDKKNLDRIKGYLDDAKQKGATVICGGDVVEESLNVLPTILTGVPENAKVLSEEVFGPILSVFTYHNIEEVYHTLQKQPKPLALYIFTQNDDFIEDVLANTSSGGVAINTCVEHYEEYGLPFGGVGQSGMGRYHGHHGFLELSHERALLHK